MKAYTYILLCNDGTLYTGWTNNLEKRIANHNLGQGAKYTRARLPVKLVWHTTFTNKIEAQKAEYRIKKYSRQKKIALINENSNKEKDKAIKAAKRRKNVSIKKKIISKGENL